MGSPSPVVGGSGEERLVRRVSQLPHDDAAGGRMFRSDAIEPLMYGPGRWSPAGLQRGRRIPLQGWSDAAHSDQRRFKRNSGSGAGIAGCVNDDAAADLGRAGLPSHAIPQ